MADQEMRCKRQCDCERHDQHLCYMIALGLHLTNEQEYLGLITEPRFRCGHCGRTAGSGDNLCVPSPLRD